MPGRSGVWCSTTAAAAPSGAAGSPKPPRVAASTLAAYPQETQRTKWSSPTTDGTMNSWFTSPPMAPDWASTGETSSPRRAKIRRYAS